MVIPNPARVKFGRGATSDLPVAYTDGAFWFDTSTGKFYLDAPIDGTLTRILLNSSATGNIPTVTVSNTAPSNPKANDIWFIVE